jgi:low affinity Fe/Cu permease
MRTSNAYSRFAKAAAHFCGRPPVFAIAVGIIVLWIITGPIFGFSDTWQLVINTGTTIITFLMVFLIQNTQNRDTQAIQIKLWMPSGGSIRRWLPLHGQDLRAVL